MADVPTFATPPTFLGVELRTSDAEFCVAGIPLDVGTTNRSGARFGPHAIRSASRMLVDGDHPRRAAERIRGVLGEAPAYLSFDVDALDPAFAPGTGTPEIGGLSTWQAQALLRQLAGVRFVGMDVVEVAPPYDVSEITALAAATMVWEYIALVSPGLELSS
jgi:arginase family enzyme